MEELWNLSSSFVPLDCEELTGSLRDIVSSFFTKRSEHLLTCSYAFDVCVLWIRDTCHVIFKYLGDDPEKQSGIGNNREGGCLLLCFDSKTLKPIIPSVQMHSQDFGNRKPVFWIGRWLYILYVELANQHRPTLHILMMMVQISLVVSSCAFPVCLS